MESRTVVLKEGLVATVTFSNVLACVVIAELDGTSGKDFPGSEKIVLNAFVSFCCITWLSSFEENGTSVDVFSEKGLFGAVAIPVLLEVWFSLSDDEIVVKEGSLLENVCGLVGEGTEADALDEASGITGAKVRTISCNT